MIKLIATDMDGTLLNSKKELPEKLPKMIQALKKRNILFVPVSGRSYACLYDRFKPFSGNMSFVCLNGNLVMQGEEVLYNSELSQEELRKLLGVLRTVPGLHISLCGIRSTYYEDRKPAFESQMKQFFTDITYVDRLEDAIEWEPICKISCSDDRGVQMNGLPRLRYLAEEYYLVDAGDNWLDIMVKDRDKGTGMRALTQCLKIGMDEVMAFGDFLNDIPMMRITKNSWAMKNGHEKVAAISGHVTEWTNDENGVIRTIEKELGISL